jgi:undecaprenyl diphosphate synthase
MEAAEKLTANNISSTLVIAVDYGGQWDIANAAKALAVQVKQGDLEPDEITAELLDRHMALADLPTLDLLIRTAGEQRISNFLLWQAAYAEFFFSDTLWPDFSEADMQEALASYRRRDRRYGRRDDICADSDVSTSVKGG